MRQGDLKYIKTWRLRQHITELNKALEWATTQPGGLHRLMIEHHHHDLRLVRLELQSRGQRKRKVEDAKELGEAVGG